MTFLTVHRVLVVMIWNSKSHFRLYMLQGLKHIHMYTLSYHVIWQMISTQLLTT